MKKPSGTIIYMESIPEKPDWRRLSKPLQAGTMDGGVEEIPAGFDWNGSSSWIFAFMFPRWRHPIASCRHDWRCGRARTPEERAWADKKFKEDVQRTSWAVTAWVGYAGVRVGALVGVGVNYK